MYHFHWQEAFRNLYLFHIMLSVTSLIYMMLTLPWIKNIIEYNTSNNIILMKKHLLSNLIGHHFLKHCEEDLLSQEQKEAGLTYIDIILQDIACRSRLVWLPMCRHESSHICPEKLILQNLSNRQNITTKTTEVTEI